MAEEFSWPVSGSFPVLDGAHIESIRDFRWIVILGGFLAFTMAWGIGANDVANAFATSVGAGSLSLRGASKKIIDASVFDPVKSNGSSNGPEILMTGFLVALISSTTWLILATYLSLPVSTTHSIIGSLIGVGIAYRGSAAVIWISSGSGFKKLRGVVGVILSWVISPVLSGIFAIIVFLLVRHTVLRTKNPVRNGFLFLPLFYGLTIAVTLFFIIYKGSPKLKLDKKFSVGQAIGIAIGCGTVVSLLSWWFLIPQAKRWVDRWEAREIAKMRNPDSPETKVKKSKVNSVLEKVGINLEIDEELDEDVIQMHDNVEKFDPKAEQLFSWLQVFTAAFDAFAHGANDVANSIGPFASIYQLYTNSGLISAPTNKPPNASISGVFTEGLKKGDSFKEGDKIPDGEAFCGSFEGVDFFSCKVRFPNLSQGDSNSKSKPFSIYDTEGKFKVTKTCFEKCSPGGYTKYSSQKKAVELWILALGGIGIVAGLAMWGYRIIVAIGMKLTKLTPSRGFSIEIGAAITVIIASRIGLPVSTTHCQVGATMGVGLVEFKKGTVNWKQFAYICAGWVFTVVFTGFLAAGIFAVLINSPLAYGSSQPGNPDHCPGQNMFIFDSEAKGFRGIGCSGTSI
eukprot:IDg8452t1